MIQPLHKIEEVCVIKRLCRIHKKLCSNLFTCDDGRFNGVYEPVDFP